MRKTVNVMVVLLLALLVIPTTAQVRPNTQPKQSGMTMVGAQTQPAKPVTATNDPNYMIGPEDVLEISVWKEPDISRTVPVRPDGKISLPLLNDIQAAGQTPTQLGQIIAEKLKKYLMQPQVAVIVGTINSRRVYLVGEVARPGAFPLLPGMTVLQALSTAGGFSLYAKEKKIYVLRKENGKERKLFFNYKDAIQGKRPEQDVLLEPGDTIVVP